MNLTGRSYALAGAAVIVGIAGQWWSALWPGTWLVVVAVWAGGLAREYADLRTHGLSVQRRCREPLRLGRRETGEVTIANGGQRPRTVELELPGPEGVAPDEARYRLTVAAASTGRVAFPIEARELGSLAWPPVAAQLLGPSGLAWWRWRPSAALTASVVPDTLADRGAARGLGRSGQRPGAEHGAGVELTGLREYVPGDPLRSIDWKATARRGEPVVKLFQQDQQLDLIVAVDAGRRSRLAAGALSRFGHYINTAAQLAERSVASGDRAAALVFADRVLGELPPGHGPAHVTRLRALLAAAQCAPRESNPLVAALAVRHLLGQRGLVVFLSDLEESEAAGQLAQAARLLAPKHLPLIATIADPEQRALMRAPPSDWMAPYRRLAALELERDRDLTARRLRRLGASVVAAEPQRLAGELFDHYDRLRRRRAV